MAIIHDRAPQIIAAMARRTGKDCVARWRAEKSPGRTLVVVHDVGALRSFAQGLRGWALTRGLVVLQVYERGRQEIQVVTISHLASRLVEFSRTSFRQVMLLDLAFMEGHTLQKAWKGMSEWQIDHLVVLSTPPRADPFNLFCQIWRQESFSKHRCQAEDSPVLDRAVISGLRSTMSAEAVASELDAEVPVLAVV